MNAATYLLAFGLVGDGSEPSIVYQMVTALPRAWVRVTPVIVELVRAPAALLQVTSAREAYLNSIGRTDQRTAPLFSSQTNEKMTPACVRSIVGKYVQMAKQQYSNLFNEPKYSPHSFRHSKAVHMVEAGVSLIYIRNFLGHNSVETTERYARVGQKKVTEALTNRKIPRLAPKEMSLRKEVTLPECIINARKRKIM